MDLYKLLEEVTDAESFLNFAEALIKDRISSANAEKIAPSSPYGPDAGGWENTTIEAYLGGAVAWARDSGFGTHQGSKESNPWRQFAEFLYGGKVYE